MVAMTAPVALQADGPAWEFVNDGVSYSDGQFNYFTAYFIEPGTERRRVVCRLIVPLDVARKVRDQANRIWSGGGH
jgi:hypothetical protein